MGGDRLHSDTPKCPNVDGGQPGWSVGASFEESVRIMRSLGATDAVNLDGGGSTTITINQQLINRPSDSTAERPIADAIGIQNGRVS
ncbi:phosphodiester glycosidase family protein [Tolypothrix campylonemoides VB511288]|nr:phosphodiester glycosidase family protein [Tolypothrix campylonemoides VB511288]